MNNAAFIEYQSGDKKIQVYSNQRGLTLAAAFRFSTEQLSRSPTAGRVARLFGEPTSVPFRSESIYQKALDSTLPVISFTNFRGRHFEAKKLVSDEADVYVVTKLLENVL